MSEESPGEQPPKQERHDDDLIQMLKTVSAFLNAHGPAIQTAIAIIMLVSLLMGWQAIELSQKQFESTIEPRLDISYGSPDFIAIEREMRTNSPGVQIAIETNITVTQARLELFVSSCTNFSRVNFDNQGAVSISNLESLMAIEIATDESSVVKEVVTDYTPQLLARQLKPNENVWHYFGGHPAIKRLTSLRPPDSRRRAVCFVLRYARSVDMKPRIRYIFFLTGTVAGSTNTFAIPLSQKTSALGNMNAAAIEIRSRYEEAARKVVEQADVIGTDSR